MAGEGWREMDQALGLFIAAWEAACGERRNCAGGRERHP